MAQPRPAAAAEFSACGRGNAVMCQSDLDPRPTTAFLFAYIIISYCRPSSTAFNSNIYGAHKKTCRKKFIFLTSRYYEMLPRNNEMIPRYHEVSFFLHVPSRAP